MGSEMCIRDSLSASQFSLGFTQGFDDFGRGIGEPFGASEIELRSVHDALLDRANNTQRFVNRAQPIDFRGAPEAVSKSSELPHRSISTAILARDANAETPAQFRDSGRGIPLESPVLTQNSLGESSTRWNQPSVDRLVTWNQPTRPTFHNGFERPEQFEQASDAGRVKAVVERKVATAIDRSTTTDTTTQLDGTSASAYANDGQIATNVDAPRRVFAPPTSFSVVALAQASNRLARGVDDTRLSSVFDSLSEPTEPPTSESHRRCLLYTSPSPRDATLSRMPSSA